MEKPQSVHLARLYYRWDLVNDCPNPNLIARPIDPKKEKKAKKNEAQSILIPKIRDVDTNFSMKKMKKVEIKF